MEKPCLGEKKKRQTQFYSVFLDNLLPKTQGILKIFLIRYFPHLHFQCYPKSPPYPPPTPLPYLPTPTFWPWHSLTRDSYIRSFNLNGD
ncbi:mCG146956 [Mus musculus]|nr:mCG146956 [Mus musculus]